MKPPPAAWRTAIGLAVAAGGLAHLFWPQKFEPLNEKLGFITQTRKHVYFNGAVETAIGLTLASPKTRGLNLVLSISYPIYLVANGIRAKHSPLGSCQANR